MFFQAAGLGDNPRPCGALFSGLFTTVLSLHQARNASALV
jgi:hypothetical protein